MSFFIFCGLIDNVGDTCFYTIVKSQGTYCIEDKNGGCLIFNRLSRSFVLQIVTLSHDAIQLDGDRDGEDASQKEVEKVSDDSKPVFELRSIL